MFPEVEFCTTLCIILLTPHTDIALHELKYYLKEERLGERGNLISYGIKRFDIPEFIHGDPRQVGGPAESDEERNRETEQRYYFSQGSIHFYFMVKQL